MDDRETEIRQKEFNALTTLRRRYRMREAGSNKWDALCPAHEDHNRSLRVYRVNDRLYFRCYAGCSFNDVRASLGLPAFKGGNKSSFRPQLRSKVWQQPTEPQTEGERVIAAYDYSVLTDTFLEDAEGLSLLPKILCGDDQVALPVESLLDADCGRAEGFPMYSRRAGNGEGGEVPISAWVWPMRDDAFNVTGLRLRFDGGAKRSFTGSKPGLFLGKRWGMPGPILIVEGATDRAAGYAWGFDTIGLPSCNDGFDFVEGFLRRIGRDREIIILMQVDDAKTQPETGKVFYPGQDGARALASKIWRIGRLLKIISPVPPFTDARSWYQAGAVRDNVDRQIAAKNQWRLRKDGKRYAF